jgi:SAM-dependent methyltransferase
VTSTASRNFGAAAGDYAKFRVGFPDSLFDRLAAFGIGRRGQAIVDLGTGTGTLARGFARRGCKVIGIDPDERMLAEARRLDQSAGVSADYRKGVAESVPLPDRTADVVSAGQCWHWFDAPRAAAEIARLTKPGGFVLVAHFDWLPWAGNAVEATERLIEAHNPDWHLGRGNGFHPESLPHLHRVGFRGFETFSYNVDVPYSPEAWRGRIRASAGVGASLSPEKIAAFDADLARLLADRFPGELAVPHCVFAAIGRAP